jgi:diguanylate cyclase (GGDEF)-like protein/PAS domain S-box-containing protein
MMDKFLCPCCSEPLLIHIIGHKKLGFCLNCHQEMPLIERRGAIIPTIAAEAVTPAIAEKLDRDQLSRGTLETKAAGIWILDRESQTVFANPKMADLLGYAPGEMVGKSLWKFMDERHPAFSAIAHRYHPRDREEEYHLSLRHRTGKPIWVTLSVRPLFDSKNQFEGNLCIAIDATPLKLMEDTLKKQSQREQTIDRLTQTIRNSLNLDRIFTTAVSELGRIFAAEAVQIVQYISEGKFWLNRAEYRQTPNSIAGQITCNSGKTYAKKLESELPSVLRSLPRVVASSPDETALGEFFQTCPGGWLPVPLYSRNALWGSLSLVMRDPAYPWQESDLKLIHGFANQLSVAIYQAELYEQLEEANRKLQQLAAIDGLTQLVSRHSFDDYLGREWEQMIEEQAPLSLILSRMEGWPSYREQQGDRTADDCLREVAKIIKQTVSHPKGLVARYGDIEFAVLLPHTNARWAVRLVDTIQEQIGQFLPQLSLPALSSQRLLSFGVASAMPAVGTSAQNLIAAAEQALDRGASRFRQYLLSQQECQ